MNSRFLAWTTRCLEYRMGTYFKQPFLPSYFQFTIKSRVFLFHAETFRREEGQNRFQCPSNLTSQIIHHSKTFFDYIIPFSKNVQQFSTTYMRKSRYLRLAFKALCGPILIHPPQPLFMLFPAHLPPPLHLFELHPPKSGLHITHSENRPREKRL